jgi:biotin transporter BioY
VAIYACGLPWLARFVGWQNVVAAGLTPFIIGDALKLVAAALLLPAAWWAVRMTLGKGTRA